MNVDQRIRWLLKPAIWIAALAPFAWLAWRAFSDDLGANPIEAITHTTGDWALRLLLVTLAITPLKNLTGWRRIVRVRRLLGLFTFFYALVHFATWLVLDQFFDWPMIVEDIVERPFITVGFAGFVLLTALAATSTTAAMRRMGGNWLRLHRAIYLIAPLGVLHFLWLVKADWLEPAIYGAIAVSLLGMRIPAVRDRLRFGRRPSRPAAPARNPAAAS